MKQLKEVGATVVVIAHRPSVLRHVDKLLVLRDGKVHMMGPRDEVFAELTPNRRQNPESKQTVRDAVERRPEEHVA